jgi:hypothetical protein
MIHDEEFHNLQDRVKELEKMIEAMNHTIDMLIDARGITE